MSRPNHEGPYVVVTDDDDAATTRCVTAALSVHGPVVILGPRSVVHLEVEIRGTDLAVRMDGEPLVLPRAIFHWRPPQPALPPADRDRLRSGDPATHFHRQQWAVLVHGLLMAWDQLGVPVVNAPTASLWDEKAAQLLAAAAVGFRTPRTLHSASLAGVRSFVRDIGGEAVLKPFVPLHVVAHDQKRVQRSLAGLVRTGDLDRLYRDAIPTPSVLQPPVAATSEVRAVVVGRRVFGAAFPRSTADHIDSRKEDVHDLGVGPASLPTDVEDRCVALVARCGLQMASLDLRVTEDGDHVFLDLNPTGQFHWVAALTGLPVYEAIAAHLAELAEHVGHRPIPATQEAS